MAIIDFSFCSLIPFKVFNALFLVLSASVNVLDISCFLILVASNSEIVEANSSLTLFLVFSKFSKFASNVLIWESLSYLWLEFSSTFFFSSSISNSFFDSFLVIASNSCSFCLSSVSNFSLFLERFSFLFSFASFSSLKSTILCFCSSISFASLSEFELLFKILSFEMLICEFICSILVLLSNPRFWASSISAINSSILDFKESFSDWLSSSFLFSSSSWSVNILKSSDIWASFSL